MKLKELKEKQPAEMQRLMTDNCLKLRDLNFKDANKQVKNVRELRVVKKTIARIKTLLKANK
jgi:ribosomal protein L29